MRTGSSCCATGSRASRHLGQFDHGSRLLASVCEFHRHKAGDRDSEMEWPNNRLQTGQRPGERIDRNNIPITCGSQRREAESSKNKGSDYTVIAVTAPVLGFEQSVAVFYPSTLERPFAHTTQPHIADRPIRRQRDPGPVS